MRKYLLRPHAAGNHDKGGVSIVLGEDQLSPASTPVNECLQAQPLEGVV